MILENFCFHRLCREVQDAGRRAVPHLDKIRLFRYAVTVAERHTGDWGQKVFSREKNFKRGAG